MTKKVRAFAIRGLAGIVYSRGMNTLTDEANKIPGVAATTEDQGSVILWFSHKDELVHACELAHQSGREIALIGHSFGANIAIMIAKELQKKAIHVALMVCIDPAEEEPVDVPSNVRRVINPFQKVDPVGRGVVQPAAGFSSRAPDKDNSGLDRNGGVEKETVQYPNGEVMRIERYRRDQAHISIDDDAVVHKLALDALHDVLAV